jgi:hypothetical protein
MIHPERLTRHEPFRDYKTLSDRGRALLEREDISAKGKKQLQAFARMERIAAEARAGGREFGLSLCRIDGKGAVIFTLASGGSVRDAGKGVFYSAHDGKAREIALLYAELKWGWNVSLEKGRILFQQESKLRDGQTNVQGWSR